MGKGQGCWIVYTHLLPLEAVGDVPFQARQEPVQVPLASARDTTRELVVEPFPEVARLVESAHNKVHGPPATADGGPHQHLLDWPLVCRA